MADVIGWVVRDVTGETQVSVRFGLQSQARSFAENCAMPVRVWRVVRKRRDAAPSFTPGTDDERLGVKVG